MNPRRLENGRLVIPVRLEGPRGELGDGVMEIGPEHPDYSKWERELPLDMVEYSRALDAHRSLRLAANNDIHHTGCMVALFPNPDDAKRLAADRGEPADEMHITLVFLGQASNVDEQALIAAVQGWASSVGPITSVISGYGYFTEGPKPVTYWSVDAPRLPAAREALVQTLETAGLPVKKDHGFTPHMTIDYKKRRVEPPRGFTMRFGSVVVAHGDNRTRIPLTSHVDLAIRFDESKIRRDLKGKFANKPGSGLRLLNTLRSPNVPSAAPQKVHDVGSDVNRAADLLSQGEHVSLDQPRTASVLLGELAKRVQEAKKLGDKAPTYDLCRVMVKNTNLFCAESKGIPRVHMPQLSGVPLPGSRADRELEKDAKGGVNLGDLFREHLAENGVKITDETEKASYLRPSQIELNGGKVGGMAKHLESGGKLGGDPRLFVSTDNYIVDGHHRWAANVAVGLGDGPEMTMDISRVDMDIIELLDESNRFAIEWGIPQQSV